MADRELGFLPDLEPGDTYEHVLAPQKFVVLHYIVVQGARLAGLAIGAVLDVPFELDSDPQAHEGDVRRYRPCELDDDLKKRLVKTGAAVATAHTIAIVPGLEIRLLLQNDSSVRIKPRAWLMGQENA